MGQLRRRWEAYRRGRGCVGRRAAGRPYGGSKQSATTLKTQGKSVDRGASPAVEDEDVRVEVWELCCGLADGCRDLT